MWRRVARRQEQWVLVRKTMVQVKTVPPDDARLDPVRSWRGLCASHCALRRRSEEVRHDEWFVSESEFDSSRRACCLSPSVPSCPLVTLPGFFHHRHAFRYGQPHAKRHHRARGDPMKRSWSTGDEAVVILNVSVKLPPRLPPPLHWLTDDVSTRHPLVSREDLVPCLQHRGT
jgi:hypothetical protein